MRFFRNPFRFKYWVGKNLKNEWMIERSILNPAHITHCWMIQLVDGPFDTQEDAVHSLNFWRMQDESRVRS